jgi:tRNA threonylcarbamoyladenosine biosynthesis protein TsaE
VLALVGPLGAGKTLFVQGIAAGLGIDPGQVTSPTFVIAGEYAAPDGQRLHHLDLYRLQSVAELEQAGFLDLLEAGAVVAIEWADRFVEELPRDHLRLEIERLGEGAGQARRLRARSGGRNADAVLARWSDRLAEAPGDAPGPEE